MADIPENVISHLIKSEDPPIKTRIEADETLVVIAANGMKFKFTKAQVEEAIEATKPEPKPASSQTPAASTTTTASKTPAAKGETVKGTTEKGEAEKRDGEPKPAQTKPTAKKPPPPHIKTA